MSKSKPGLLIVETTCGLCNRLRAIDSAVAFAEQRGDRLHIIWFADPDLNCRYSDLFEPLPAPARFWQFSLSPRAAYLAKRLLHGVARRFCDVFLREDEIGTMVKAGYDFGAYSQMSRIYLKTWDRFYPSTHLFSMFRPVKRIARVIDGYSNRLANAVGVHIRRRTEENWLIENSPTQNFIDYMHAEIECDPNVEFFLATDDQQEESKLAQAFPGRIFTHPKQSRRRDDQAGIEDAVIDLYCLAGCRKVLGSWRSSFSETAILLSGRPGIMIR
jgi:hypothetical protein